MFNEPDTYYDGYGWADLAFALTATTLSPGEGGFISLPNGTSADVTMVGEVPQGTLSVDLVQNFQIISQVTPQSVGIEATGFPAGDGDTALFWDPVAQAFAEPLTFYAGYGWADLAFALNDPTPALGEAFFYNRVSGTDTWTRTFSVNP
jgi:hypothetical protein